MDIKLDYSDLVCSFLVQRIETDVRRSSASSEALDVEDTLLPWHESRLIQSIGESVALRNPNIGSYEELQRFRSRCAEDL